MLNNFVYLNLYNKGQLWLEWLTFLYNYAVEIQTPFTTTFKDEVRSTVALVLLSFWVTVKVATLILTQ